jgi:uncharacterized protein YidB (DUF937 family)
LDGVLGNVIGSMLSNQGQNPLDTILGNFSRGSSAGGNPLLQIVLSLLQQNGGLEGVIGKFRHAGLGAQADSWVGTGQNMELSPDQLQQVFGSSTIGAVASKLGVSHEDAGSAMSQILPELINQLTPQGQVTSAGDDSIAEGLDALARGAGR